MAIFRTDTFNSFKKIRGAMAHLAHPVAAALLYNKAVDR